MSAALEVLPDEVPACVQQGKKRREITALRTKRLEVVKICRDYGFDPVKNLIMLERMTDDFKLKVAINMELLSYIAPKPTSIKIDANITVSHEVALAALE